MEITLDKNISVLMSVYKNEIPENVRKSVESVVNQTLKPKQIVMVVDGVVTEELKKELLQFEKDYDIYENVWLEENGGLGNAMKEGTKYCKYEIIARMDSDDICIPTRFEKEVEFLESHPEIDVVGSLSREFYEDDENQVMTKVVPETHEQIIQFMKLRCPFCHMTVMMKKDMLIKAGGYEHWLLAEDWYLWIRMYLVGAKFYNIQEPLVLVRINQNTFERRHGIKYYKSIKGLLKYMKNHKMISFVEYLKGKIIRFVGHVLVPKNMKNKLYRKHLRKR